MKIIIETKPLSKMRTKTLGDWYRDARGNLHIDVAAGHKQGIKAEVSVAIHELIEVLLCEERGMGDEEVTAWDVSHPDTDDPGMVKGAPYRKEHIAATAVEREAVRRLGLGSFAKYNNLWSWVWSRE
jgi:hypothetical protein